jgi:hypothetical protein
MARFVSFQTNFSTGELDPRLRARVDIDQFRNALEQATNVVIQPQGGLKRRPGLKHILELPNTSTDSVANGVRLIPFEFNVDDSYMLAFTHQRMYVIKNGVVITAINGGANNYLTTSITAAMLDDISWTQSADTLIVVHPDLQPTKIVRGATDANWTASAISFDGVPLYAFTENITTPTGTLTPSAISSKITLTASASVFHDGRTGTAQAGTSTSITLDSGASGTDDIYNGSTVTITGGTGSGQIRVISDYVGSTKVATVSVAWATTPDNTSTFSVSSQVGQYVNAIPQGRARIVAITSATVVNAVTEFPFFNTAAIASGNWDLEQGYEDVWSTTRGWPRTATFHEGRLYFGGSKSRPATIWGSKVGIFFDFKQNEALDDDAIEATLDTNQLNVITDMISGRDFQVFTTGGEFYVPQTSTDPITPLRFVFKAVSRNGMKPGTRVQAFESGTVFIQRQGEALNEFLFSDAQLTYITQRISLLSGHLLRAPKRMALHKATDTDQGDLLLISNADDGSLAVYSILRSQNVIAPSEFITDGEFLDVGVDVTDIYVVTERVFNNVTRYFVELMDYSLFTDCAFVGANASGATGLPHIGKSVNVITDGVPQSNETVTSGGGVTFDRPSVTNFEVGLPFVVTAKTMPVELQLQSGTRVAFKKRIAQVNAIVYESQHLNINNQPVPFRNFGSELLDEPVPEFSGIKRLDAVRGYSREAQITITQTLPLKMNLLGLEYKVAVHQGT